MNNAVLRRVSFGILGIAEEGLMASVGRVIYICVCVYIIYVCMCIDICVYVLIYSSPLPQSN